MNGSDKINLGIVGGGMVSQIAHIPAFYKNPNVNLVALADHNVALASIVASRFSIPQVYSSHQELLANPKVSAVIIVVHRYNSPDIVRDALLAGKHVMVEKPMALTSNVAQELSLLAKRKNLELSIGFMKRHDLGVRRGKEILEQAKQSGFGKIVNVRCRNYCSQYVGYCDDYVQSFIRKQRKLDKNKMPKWLPYQLHKKYDWFMNVGSHTINLLQYFLGRNIKIKYADFSSSLSTVIIAKINSIPILIDVGKTASGKWEENIEFYFEYARMKIALTSLMQRDQNATITLDSNIDRYRRNIESPAGPWSFTLQAQNFINCLRGQATLLSNVDDCVLGVKIVEEIWRCYLNKNK